MTVIAGMRLSKKLYLISDTRVTNRDKHGSIIGYQNNLAKIVRINQRITVVAAGNVDLASFLIIKIKSLVRPNSSASYLNYIFKNNLDEIIKEFVNNTGKTDRKAVLIFGGYNINRKQQIDSKILGDVMTALPMKNEGKMVYQVVCPEISESLFKATRKKPYFDEMIIVDIPQSELISLEVRIDRNDFNTDYKSYECYESAIYHPPTEAVEKIRISNDLLCDLEFRNQDPNCAGSEIINQDVAKITSYIYDLVEENNFESVGGNIIVAFQTQYGNAFPTGMFVRRDGKKEIKFWNKLFVDPEDTALCYELSNGESGKYRHLEIIFDDSSMDLI